MKRTLLQLIFTFLLAFTSTGQGQWAWMKGDTAVNYFNGIVGLSDPTFEPSCRYAGVGWYDNNDGLWMYSGQGATDLWRYSITDNEWWWVKDYGPTYGNYPAYGTQGVAADTVAPGHVGYGTSHWVTDSNYLWMLNPNSGDLFRFDIAQQNWAWMNGPGISNLASPIYGTQGVPADSVSPGDMNNGFEIDNRWVDGEGNFWLFHGKYGTVWRYSPNLNQWAWMHGTQAPVYTNTPFYSAIGEFDPAGLNTPGTNPMGGGNKGLLSWQDSSHHFWTFLKRPTNNHIELWEFDPVINKWACHLDEEDLYFPAVQCEESTINRPKLSFFEHRSVWVDNCDNAYALIFDTVLSRSNLWRINTESTSFTLVNSYDGHHCGTQGMLDGANHPTLSVGSISWTANHEFWYRGSHHGGNSTLWKYVPDSVHANFSYSANSVTCEMDFTNESSSGCNTIKSQYWDFGDGQTSSEVNPSHYYEIPGTYQVMLIVENCSWDIDTLILDVLAEHNCPIELTLDYEDSLCDGDCIYFTYETNIPLQSLHVNGEAASSSDSVEVCPIENTDYIITAIGENGTIDEDTLNLTILSPPTLIVVDNQTLCPPDSLVLDAGAADTLVFLWSTGCTLPATTVYNPGVYWVLAEDGNCHSSDTITVTLSCTVELEMPNVFTPSNHDGINDLFSPISHEAIVEYQLTIFNRWGNEMFETTDINEGWNGTFKGNTCQAGTYFWVVSFTGYDNKDHVLHGNVTLIR